MDAFEHRGERAALMREARPWREGSLMPPRDRGGVERCVVEGCRGRGYWITREGDVLCLAHMPEVR